MMQFKMPLLKLSNISDEDQTLSVRGFCSSEKQQEPVEGSTKKNQRKSQRTLNTRSKQVKEVGSKLMSKLLRDLTSTKMIAFGISCYFLADGKLSDVAFVSFAGVIFALREASNTRHSYFNESTSD